MTSPAFTKAARAKGWHVLCLLSVLWAGQIWADQVEMSNGDRYAGRVLSMSADTLVLQSEVLGNLRLPRAKISTISLEPRPAASATNVARFALRAPKPRTGSGSAGTNTLARSSERVSTNASSQFSAALQQLGANTNMLRQVQEQFLTGAGPEAQAKFNSLMGGLLNGNIDLAGLRAEAKSTLQQARSMRGDMGEQGATLDSYLAILDSFLKETEPEAAPANTPLPAPHPATGPKPVPPEQE